MKHFKTLFRVREHRRKWIAWSVSLTVFFWFVIVSLDHFRIANKFSINPFTVIKDYIDNKASPPYVLMFMILIICVILTTVKMIRAISELKARGVDWSEDNTYGSAKEATEEELQKIAAVHPVDECEGTILGSMTQDGNKNVLEFRKKNIINSNMLILGPPGTGKSWCFVLSAVYQAIKRGESIIVADTKGAIYNATIELARKNGYLVRCFNLKDFQFSHGWNIFRECYDPKTGEISPERVTMLAETIIKNKAGDTGEKIYIDGPTALLEAAIHFVGSNSDYGEGRGKKPRTLESAYKLMLRTTESDLDQLFNRDNKLCSDAAYDAYDTYKRSSQNFRGNLVTNLTTYLKSLAQPLIKELTSRDEIDLSLPAKQKCVYYLTVPDMENPYEIYSALFVQFLFRDMTECADSLPTQRCPVTVNMILDEFANLGTLLEFEKKPATTRSRGINIAVIVQSLAQLRKKYFDSWETIGNTCGTWLGLGFNDLFTMDYFSTMAGQATISTKSEQQPAHTLPFVALPHSIGEGKRNVFNSDELRRLEFEEEVVLFQGKNVLKCYKFPHDRHPFSKECIPTQISFMPLITDRKGRDYWFAMENERVTQYYAWLNSGMKGPAPNVYTLEELASGKITLTDYKNERPLEEIQVDSLTFESLDDEEENHFKGNLSVEEKAAMTSTKKAAHHESADKTPEPAAQAATLFTVPSNDDDEDDTELPDIEEEKKPELPKFDTASNMPGNLADILQAEDSQNDALAAAFGIAPQGASAMPKQQKRRPDWKK